MGSKKSKTDKGDHDHDQILRHFFSKKRQKFDDELSLSTAKKALTSNDFSETTIERVIDIFVIGNGDLQALVNLNDIHKYSATSVKCILNKDILQLNRNMFMRFLSVKDPKLIKYVYNLLTNSVRASVINYARDRIYSVDMDLCYTKYKALEEISGERFQISLNDYIYDMALELIKLPFAYETLHKDSIEKFLIEQRYLKRLEERIKYGFVVNNHPDTNRTYQFHTLVSNYENCEYFKKKIIGSSYSGLSVSEIFQNRVEKYINDINMIVIVHITIESNDDLNDEIIKIVLD